MIPFLIFDGVRYSIATGAMVLYDALIGVWNTLTGQTEEEDWYCPSVAVMIVGLNEGCLLYTSPSPRDATLSRMPSSA